MHNDEPVCFCNRVTAGEIRQAKLAGAQTIDDIRRMTGACTLGRCKEQSPRGR
ncbi:MAG: (2Fe-2S)-binding protein [Geobacteraceae bacterium]|nr:(2Fe-2S)-binding protein [Geobacteraceae bacterium]